MQNDPTGTAPEQVIVFETVGAVENFLTAIRHTVGMSWLADWAEEEIPPDEDFYLEDMKKRDENLSGRLYLVMSNQKAIEQMLSLWEQYKADPNVKFDRGLSAWKTLFAHLRDVRRWGVRDRLEETGILGDWQERIAHHVDPIRFEVELWCQETEEQQRHAFEVFRRIVEEENGRCVIQSVIPEIAYHGVLIEAPASTIVPILEQQETKLVRANEVMFFRPLGQSAFPIPEEIQESPTDSEVSRPSPQGEPIVALLDGMPLENHSLLTDRLVIDDPDEWAIAYQATERHHGTAMASLIVHGELDTSEPPLERPLYVRPIMKPNPDDWQRPREEHMPQEVLPIDLLHRAVRRMIVGDGTEPPAAPQVRIVNLSIGDPSQPFDRYTSPWARLLDWLAWQYNLVFIVSAGNHFDDIELNVPRALLSSVGTAELQAETLKAIQNTERYRTLLAPAEAINAVTVGAIHADSATLPLSGSGLNPYLDGFLPSPYCRIGPGFRRSVKPEIFVPGGRILYREKLGNTHLNATLQILKTARAPGHRTACPGSTPGNISAYTYTRGTSNAAALASRAAALIYEKLLELRNEPNGECLDDRHLAALLKALLVHGAYWGESRNVLRSILGRDSDERAFRSYIPRYLGYGAPQFARVISSTDQRATVVGCGSLADGAADLFRIPLPPSLNAQRIWRRLILTLAWNSPINPRHQKYRQAQLWFRPHTNALGVEGKDVWWQVTERGTIQHLVLEGESATVFADGDALELQINCRADAGKLNIQVPYGITVTLEVAESINVSIYNEIRSRLQTLVPVPTSA
ncbi:MAG: S8 family peptidase [Candidatus Binatia bacterium]